MAGFVIKLLEEVEASFIQTAVWYKPNATDEGGMRLCSAFEVLVFGWKGQKGAKQYFNFKSNPKSRHN